MNKKGFTLLELLVVVLIIGILASVALPQYRKAVRKAHLAEWSTYLNGYTKAIDMWVLANGGYPTDTTEFTGTSTSPNVHMDLDLDFTCTTGALASQCRTNVGDIHAGCSAVPHCWVNLKGYSGSNFLQKTTDHFYINKTPTDTGWMLREVTSSDTQLLKLMCQYWKEHYGVGRMREEAQTACAGVGVN